MFTSGSKKNELIQTLKFQLQTAETSLEQYLTTAKILKTYIAE